MDRSDESADKSWRRITYASHAENGKYGYPSPDFPPRYLYINASQPYTTATMQSPSSTPHIHNPSTPGPLTRRHPSLSIPIQTHQAINSSPLSPAQRRQSSYKSPFAPLLSASTSGSSEAPQKTFLRERFRAKCFERVKRDRDRALRRGRSRGSLSGGSSDADEDIDIEFDMEENEDDEDSVLQDEVCYRGWPPFESVQSNILSSSSEESCKMPNEKHNRPTVYRMPMK